MSFRAAAPIFQQLRWRSYAKSMSASLPDKCKIQVQTPRFPCVLEPGPGVGMTRLRLVLSARKALHREFMDFLEHVEGVTVRQVTQGTAAGAEMQHRDLSSSLYVYEESATLGLMVFSECQWFDHTGTIIDEDITEYASSRKLSAAAMCDFGGIWLSESRWGLKWTVREVKLYPPMEEDDGDEDGDEDAAETPGPVFLFVDETEAPPPMKRQRVAPSPAPVCMFIDD